jgi:hypothetical protein
MLISHAVDDDANTTTNTVMVIDQAPLVHLAKNATSSGEKIRLAMPTLQIRLHNTFIL